MKNIKRWLIEQCAEADCCQLDDGWDYNTGWNPLENDHDAFRMMAYHNVSVSFEDNGILINSITYPNVDLSHYGEPELRRAIVMAISGSMVYRGHKVWIEWDGKEYVGGAFESEYFADDFFVLYMLIKTMIDKVEDWV